MVNLETNDGATKTVDTRISKVTVYSDRARVTRRGMVALTGVERELAIVSLPFSLQPESVRATGLAKVAVQLLSVRAERLYTTEPVGEKVTQIARQINQLEEQKRSLQDQIQALQLQLNFVKTLAEKSADRFSRSLAQQQVGLHETGELLNFVGRQYAELSSAIAREEKQQQELDKQLEALYHQLHEVQNPHQQESWTIFVAVAPAGAGEFELEVSYQVNLASWTPLYDLRVNATGEQLNLTYLAEVQQNTGEDWIDIALTLSTAKPGLGTLPPKLVPWYVDTYKPFVPPSFAMRKRSVEILEEQRRSEEVFDDNLAMSQASDADESQEEIAAESVAAEVSTEGGVVTFELGVNSHIPSDNNPHKVTIFNDNYQSRPEYVAFPRLVSFAYLQAVVTNPTTGVTLLPGKANIFRENTFVGTAQIQNIATGQEFKVNLGIDEGLKIERDLAKRQVDKKMMSGKRRITYAYRSIVENLSDREAILTLAEQLPVSRSEQIKIRLTQMNPKVQMGEMGVLEWALTLPAQGKQEIYYEFEVEHPPAIALMGLDI